MMEYRFGELQQLRLQEEVVDAGSGLMMGSMLLDMLSSQLGASFMSAPQSFSDALQVQADCDAASFTDLLHTDLQQHAYLQSSSPVPYCLELAASVPDDVTSHHAFDASTELPGGVHESEYPFSMCCPSAVEQVGGGGSRVQEVCQPSPSTDTDGLSDKAPEDGPGPGICGGGEVVAAAAAPCRPKRKRSKCHKKTEDVESQRMTHIAVERNRRKQMNEHLSVLRSLMPGSYVPKSDQASIIGGAIEFVKELEHLLQCLQAQKRRKFYADALSPKPVVPRAADAPTSLLNSSPVYPTAAAPAHPSSFLEPVTEVTAESKSAVADVEVKMVGSEAVVKIMSQRRAGQLVKAIAALESLHLTISHTNITTIEHTVLYSFTVKIGVECRFTVAELAAAVQQTFGAIHNHLQLNVPL